MRHRIDARALALLFAILPASAPAQWPVNGVPLTTASTSPATHAVCPDGSGGIIVAWSELRNGQYDILAGRATASGVSTWTPEGAVVCAASFDQVSPSACTDGSGGAIVVWRDHRSGGGLDIYAQRIDAHGRSLWAKDGVAICTVSNNQYAPVIVPDGAGGAVIAWYDYRALNYDIFTQRVDAGGNVLWLGGGVGMCVEALSQFNPVIVTDGAGGAIIAWTDLRGGNADVFARRVSAGGVPQWLSGGVAICTNGADQLDPALVADGAGGAIVVWRDVRGGTWDVYAQRVSSSGSGLWTVNGVAVCNAAFDQLRPQLTSDGGGGAIVAWDDARGANVDVYAQRLNGSGAPQWALNGVVVGGAASGQTRPSVVSDGAAGAIIAWEDRRAGNADVYAQRVSPTGASLWTANGVAVCIAAGDQVAPLVVTDGAGGAAMAWRDSRAGNVDLYAHRVGAAGGTPTGVGGPASTPGLVVSPGHPNPFSNTVQFEVDARGSAIRVEVFDVAGRRVARRELRGNGTLSFEGRDERGRALPSGVYLFRFSAGGATATRKVILAR